MFKGFKKGGHVPHPDPAGQARYWEGFRDGVDCRSCYSFGQAGRCDVCTPLKPVQWAPERIELLVHLEACEAWFPAVYQPMTSMFGNGCPDTYSVCFPAVRLLDQAGADLARFGLSSDNFLVKDAARWSDGMATLTARSKQRPEVGVLNTGCNGLDFRAGVSFLADLAREADARNLSRDQMLKEQDLSVQLLAVRGDQFSGRYTSSVRRDQYILSLQKVYVRNPG